MMIGRPIGEVVRALAVLALIFLNFAHAPMAAPAQPDAGWAIAAVDSFCGSPPGEQNSDHAPCHACRIGSGADLPPSSTCPVVVHAAASVRYTVSMRAPGGAVAFAWPLAQAPPRFV